MVCIAAFIVLCLIGVFVAFLSIFRRDIGRKYWQVFKKAWGCVWKKVRLQKCETNFKDDVKNTLLKKVVLKRPKLVKPLSITIEVASVLIVFVTIWSLVETTKAGLALWVFGTCNVSQPASCALGAEACSIDAGQPKNAIEYVGRWFSEWGEIFSAIPDRLKDWSAEDYVVSPYIMLDSVNNDLPLAVDIVDPGCSVCLQSYKNQLASDFLNTHRVAVIPYAIENEDGTYKFQNSGLIVRYLLADLFYRDSRELSKEEKTLFDKVSFAKNILHRIFTEYSSDNINYQTVFNENLDAKKAEQLLQSWLKEWGLSTDQIKRYANFANSDAVTAHIEQIKDLVENKVHAKSIPTIIYDNRKHNGLFKI